MYDTALPMAVKHSSTSVIDWIMDNGGKPWTLHP